MSLKAQLEPKDPFLGWLTCIAVGNRSLLLTVGRRPPCLAIWISPEKYPLAVGSWIGGSKSEPGEDVMPNNLASEGTFCHSYNVLLVKEGIYKGLNNKVGLIGGHLRGGLPPALSGHRSWLCGSWLCGSWLCG